MTSRPVLLVSVCAVALLAGGCSDESSNPGTTTTTSTSAPAATVAATTTTVAVTTVPSTSTTSTTTTSTPATTTTTIEVVMGLTVSAMGLGDALFGADADGVVGFVNSILGIPTTDSGWIDPVATGTACPGNEVRFVDWNDLSLFFTDSGSGVRHFASFTYGPAFSAAIAPYGLTTDAGIGVGSTVASLRAAYPAAAVNPDDGFTGPNFHIEEGLYGFLTGADDTDTIISFVGGFGCGE